MHPNRRLLIVSNCRVSGEALRFYLTSKRRLDQRMYQVTFVRSRSLVELAEQDGLRPEVVLFHCLAQPAVDVAAIQALYPFSKILLIAHSPSDEQKVRWIREGARGVVDECGEAALGQLDEALETILRDEVWATRRILSMCLRNGSAPRAATPDRALTDRERELMGLLRLGLSNSGIAERLRISQKTVKGHLTNIYRKLDVDNRVQAVLKSRQTTAAT